MFGISCLQPIGYPLCSGRSVSCRHVSYAETGNGFWLMVCQNLQLGVHFFFQEEETFYLNTSFFVSVKLKLKRNQMKQLSEWKNYYFMPKRALKWGLQSPDRAYAVQKERARIRVSFLCYKSVTTLIHIVNNPAECMLGLSRNCRWLDYLTGQFTLEFSSTCKLG